MKIWAKKGYKSPQLLKIPKLNICKAWKGLDYVEKKDTVCYVMYVKFPCLLYVIERYLVMGSNI